MGFSVVLFGTPLGYKYEKIDIPTGDSVCPDSMARFDSFEVHKLGLRPSEQIWVIFKQMTDDGKSVIGLGLYQSAYEYNQDRSGGYYGVGLLLQDVNCSDFEKLKNITERIFSLTSKSILENNKHNNGSYKDLKSALIKHGTFNKCKEEISSLLINETVPDEDLAKLKPSYLYACSKDISKFFYFLIKNKAHFDSFVCFGIDTNETMKSVEQLGNKKLYSPKDLIAQLDKEIENGVINAKENRLRSSYQAALNDKQHSEKKLEELDILLQTNTQKIDQLELSKQSLVSEIHRIGQDKQANEAQLEANKNVLAELTSEMKRFGKETGRELLVAKPKPMPAITETLQGLSQSSFGDLGYDRVASDYIQNSHRTNKSTQQPRQTRSHRSDGSNSISIVLIGLCIIAIGLIIAVVYIVIKDSKPNVKWKSENIINGTQQDVKPSPEIKTSVTQKDVKPSPEIKTNVTQQDFKPKPEDTTNAKLQDSKLMPVSKINTLVQPPTSLKN